MRKYTPSKPDPLNRRIHPRTQTEVRAVARLPDLDVACVIRDRSLGGARLVTTSGHTLPEIFDLVETRSGTSRRVQLIWVDRRQAGVRFAEAAEPSAAGGQTAQA